MSGDEFDNIPDDFADISGVDWARILAGPSSASIEDRNCDLPRTGLGEDIPVPSIPAPTSGSSSSTVTDNFEDDYDDLDPSLLAELDRIEGELSGAVVPQPPSESTSDLQPSHYFSALNTQKKRKNLADSQPGEETLDVVFKKKCLDDTSCPTSSKGKGKMKVNDDILPRILSGYEDEITCPICCDFYAFAHVSNPCGHSFCGSCGREWHMKNKSCPVCRTRLENASPMIPNIVVDNIVEKHIQALALNGDQDWVPGGLKAEEWHKRKQTWRNSARDREKSSAAYRTTTLIPSVIDLTAFHASDQQPNWFRIEDNLLVPIRDGLETDPTYQDSDLIPRPTRRRRQRRRATPATTMVNNHS